MNKNKRNLFIVGVIVLIVAAIFFIFQLNKENTKEEAEELKTHFSDKETLLYLGDKKSNNEILFLFDYSCPWCTTWMTEVFPEIEPLIEAKEVRFRAQSLTLLDLNSYQLTQVDQIIKEIEPALYFDFFIDEVTKDREEDITDDYIEDLAKKYDIDVDKLLDEPSIDVYNLTNDYTDGYEMERVPTVVVNGEKVADPFDVEEIKAALDE